MDYQTLYDKHDYCTAGVGLQHIADQQGALLRLELGSVLELGAGRGEVVDWALQNGFAPVCGVDIANTGHHNISSGVDIPKALPELASALYDYVWSFDFLEHLQADQIAPLLKECARIAKRGQIHAIWTCSDIRCGVELHTCRQPKEWWLEQIPTANYSVRPGLKRDRFWLFIGPGVCNV